MGGKRVWQASCADGNVLGLGRIRKHPGCDMCCSFVRCHHWGNWVKGTQDLSMMSAFSLKQEVRLGGTVMEQSCKVLDVQKWTEVSFS